MHEHATWVGDFFQFDGSFPFQQYVLTQLHLRVIRGCEGGGGGPGLCRTGRSPGRSSCLVT